MKWLLKYFGWLPALYLFVPYCLVSFFCDPTSAAYFTGPEAGPASLEAFGANTWYVFAGALTFVPVTFAAAIKWMGWREIKLLLLGRLIDMHNRADKNGYLKVWLRRRVLSLWRQVNPSDKKESLPAIQRIIMAGYGLMPKAMPKASKSKRAPRKIPSPTAGDILAGGS